MPAFRGQQRILIPGALISVAFLAVLELFLLESPDFATRTAADASVRMARALAVIADHCRGTGRELDRDDDPNGTFLIGPEHSPIATTLGHLDAKRTTANPRMAGLIVELLLETGVKRGDRVAIGASGSFPALMLASVCAVEALGAEPAIILSIGASSYGATRPDFTLIDIYDLLLENGIFTHPPAACALGGTDDVGREFPDSLRNRYIADLRQGPVPFIYTPDLRENVAARMTVYKPGSTAAFVNCGGSWANMGTSSKILYLKPGLNREADLPKEDQRGVIFEMLSHHVPVIHLLFIRGLVQAHGLAWDPVPLPDVSRAGVRRVPERKRTMCIVLSGLYLGGLGLIVAGKPATKKSANENNERNQKKREIR